MNRYTGPRRKSSSRPIVLFAVFCLVFFSASCSARKTPDEIVAAAKSDIAAGKYNTAMIELKNLLHENPNLTEAWLVLSEVSLRLARPEDAVSAVQKAAQLGAKPDEYYLPLGKALLAGGKAVELTKELHADEVSNPNIKASVMVLRGDAYLRQSKTNEADVAFREALKLHPEYGDALAGMAQVSAVRRNFTQAETFIDSALKQAPQKMTIVLKKAQIEFLQAKYQDAERIAEQALAGKKNPLYPLEVYRAYTLLAEAQMRQQKFIEALNSIKFLEKMAPDQLYPQYMHAVAAFQTKDYNTANQKLQAMLKKNPRNEPAQLLLAAVAYIQKNMPQSEMYLNNILGTDPTNVNARKLLSLTLYKEGESGQAVQVLRQANTGTITDAELLDAIRKAASTRPGEMPDLISLPSGSDADRLRQAATLFGAGRVQQSISALEQLPVGKGDQAFERARLLVLGYFQEKKPDKAIAAAKAYFRDTPGDIRAMNLLGATYIGAHNRTMARKTFREALQKSPTNSTTLLNLAQLNLSEKKYKDAISGFEKVLKNEPKNSSALTGIARVYDAQGKKEEAAGWAEKARVVDPKAIAPRLALVVYYNRKQEFPRSRPIAVEVEKLAGSNQKLLMTLASVQLDSGNAADALPVLDKLVGMAPDNMVYLTSRGRAEVILNKRDAARADLESVIAKEPDYLPATVLLVQLDIQEKHPSSALKLARDLRSYKKTETASYTLEGDILMHEKNYPKAAAAYKTAYKKSPTRTLMLRTYTASSKAKLPDSIAVLTAWLKKNPEDVLVHDLVAQEYMSNGNLADAERQYKAMVKLEPTDVVALNNLAWLLGQRKDSTALVYAKKAHELAPKAASINDTYGWLLVESGKAKDGLTLLEEAYKYAPNNGDIQFHLASTYSKLGNTEKARNVLEKLLKSDMKFSERDAANKLYEKLKGN